MTSSQSGEVKVWDAETNLELLTLPAQMQSVWFDDSGLELTGEEESTVSGEITVRRWNVGHRSAQFEAEQIVRELTTPTIGEPLPLLSEIVERIAADQQLPRETRDAAIALAKGPGRVPVIHEIAWSVVYLPGQSPERYQRALRMIEEICERDPNNGAQWRTRALAHVRLGQPDAALQAMSRMQAIYAAQKLSLAAKDLVTLSLVQLHAGQQDQALANLQLARSKYIRDVFWSTLLAEAESLLGADYARQWIGRRVMPRYTLTPVDKSGASIHLSIPYTVTGAQDDLLVIGEGMIPRLDVVLLEDAVTYYSNALEVMTGSDITLNLRGVAWRAAGEFDKAIADYTASIQLKPNEDYYRNRGQVWLYDKHEIDKALADFDNALELNPNNSWSLVERGNLLAMKGDYDGAFQSLDRAIQVSPDDDYAYGVRAWILATSPNDQHRNGALAIEDATKACELTHWQDGDWVENLAAGYAETGDFEKAVEWQEKAVALKPLAERADFESHLKLYREGKPFRDTTYSTGNITEASSTSN